MEGVCRGGSPSPKPNRAFLPLDRWRGLNLHEFVIDLIEITFVYCSQAMLGLGLAGAEDKSPTAKMQCCENPPEGYEGFQHLLGYCRCPCGPLLPRGQTRADTSQLHPFASLFLVEITTGKGWPQIAWLKPGKTRAASEQLVYNVVN